MLSGQLALIVAALFAGAAVYINVAEQPARLRLDDRALLTEWKPAYKRGFAMPCCSMLLRRPAFGMIASSEFGMAAWSCSATRVGLRRSSSPHRNSVGIRM